MNESWEGFAQRMQRLNPLFELGRGMEVGELKPHIQTILMQVLLTIFYRELNDDDQRRKSDIKYMVEDSIKQMRLLADDKQIDLIGLQADFYTNEKRSIVNRLKPYITMK